LRIFALDIPLFGFAQVHRNILTGLGRFRERAYVTGGLYLSRLMLILLLVVTGLSVKTAILAGIGASLIESLMARYFIRPSWFMGRPVSSRSFWTYSLPLFFFAISLRLFEKMDLFAIKILGGSAAQAGFYSAAQSLTLFSGVLIFSFSPLLLSVLSRTLAEGNTAEGKKIIRQVLRGIILLLPLGGIAAGAAPEIVDFIFGPPFHSAAPLFAVLSFGALALLILSMTTAILTAISRPWRTLAVGGILVPLAAMGHLLLIPRWGLLGASLVTTFVASSAALATFFMVYRLCDIILPWLTFFRSAGLTLVFYWLADFWPSPHWQLFIKLTLLTGAIPLFYGLLGEFKAGERVWFGSLVKQWTKPFWPSYR
jgi:O-antigen/teichoic acid export membrane protein